MTTRTLVEIGGTLGWLLVAFGSPMLLAMYTSSAGFGGQVDVSSVMEPVPAVRMASLSLAKQEVVRPPAASPVSPKATKSTTSSKVASSTATPRKGEVSNNAVKGGMSPSLAALRKSSLSAAKRGRKRPCTGADSPDIARGEGSSWEVSRGLVNHYATHLKEFDALGYAVSHETDGGDKGMRVGGIRCDNELHQVGLRNGDVVLEVNGREVSSWMKALWLYNTVNKKQDIVVTILRRGEKRDLTYRLI
jgi:membrane-associated protease RseP (regulator of RpoE activity)